jgi:hypothetical protein
VVSGSDPVEQALAAALSKALVRREDVDRYLRECGRFEHAEDKPRIRKGSRLETLAAELGVEVKRTG